jgi:uncharacterized membrane protein YgcG
MLVIPPLGPAARSRRAAVQEREERVVERLHTLAPALDGEPNPEFQARTRARLVARAAVRQPATEAEPAAERPVPAPAAPARWRGRLTAGLAGAALAVTTAAGAVALSTGAGPGDVLYGVKRSTEQTQLALASDARRGETLLDFASTRLGELQDLLGGGDADPALVADTLATMDQQTRDGAAWQGRLAVERSDAAPLEELASWQDGQAAGLRALQAEVPPAAADRYSRSLTLLDDVGVRVDALEGAVQCAAGPATSGTDALGPVPATCAPEGAEPGTPGSPGSPGGTGTTGNPGEVPATGGTGSGGGAPGSPGGGGTGSGGGTGGAVPTGPDTPVGDDPGLPTVNPTLPRLPTPSLPTPSLPLPSLPPLGGSSGGQEQGTDSGTSPSPTGGLLCGTPLDPVLC